MPHNKDYTIGKGIVLFRPDGQDNSFQDMGNCPEMTLSLDSEALEHYSSRAELQKKDMELLIRAAYAAAFTLDEPHDENLSKWFMADAPTERDQAALIADSPVHGETDVDTETTVKQLGAWIPLYNDVTGERVYNVSLVTVADQTPDTLVEGAEGVGNYQVNTAAGMIYINKDQATPTVAIAVDTVLDITLTAAATADIAKTDALTRSEIKGHIYFVGAPPQGRIIDIGAYCSIKPAGDLGLISDEWMQMQFEAEFLEHSSYTPGLCSVIDRGRVG